MTLKERERLKVVEQIEKGVLTYSAAAAQIGVSERQLYRSMERYRSAGDAGLVHRLRGSTSNKRKALQLKSKVLKLYRQHYGDYGPTLFMEMLRDHHRLALGVETLRQWLLHAGLWTSARKGRRHRTKRPRRPAIGDLVQFDGSHHAWFEQRGPQCCLLVAIDDACNRVMLRMAQSEDTQAVLTFWKKYVERFGVPAETYVDYAGVYYCPNEAKKTDWGYAMQDLGSHVLYASSPEAKGRVERMNRTLQDRLLKALRRCRISTIDEANRFIEHEFEETFNRRFARTTADDGIARADHHRPLVARNDELARIFAYRQVRSVRKDMTIVLDNRWIQLTSAKSPLPPPRSSVDIRHFLDGTLHVFWQENEISFKVLDATWTRPKKLCAHPPSEQHPWRWRSPIGKARRRPAGRVPRSHCRPNRRDDTAHAAST